MIFFLTLLSSFIIVYLGFLVFYRSMRSATNTLFLVHSISTAIWLIFNYMADSVAPGTALVWIRLVMMFAIPSIFSFFLFVINFPREKLAISKRTLILIGAWVALLMGSAMSPFVFMSSYVNAAGQPVPVAGLLMPYFGASILAIPAVTFYLIAKKYRASTGIERLQWRSISLGLGLTYFCVLTLIYLAIVFFHTSALTAYSPLFVIPTIVGASYAILKHRLLNIKVLATEILSVFLIFLSVWQVFLAQDAFQLALQAIAAFLVLIFSISLINAVQREVQQREQLQMLSAELEKANLKLLETDKAKSEFLSVASHQLRTPLTAIKGYVSMLLEGDFGQLSEQQITNLRIVYDSSKRLVDLISDLLDLSRIESGRMAFEFGPVNLCQIVESVMDELSAKAERKGLYLYFDNVNRACPKISADAEKLRQVVINLIDNGIKYTTKGGVTVRLLKVGNELQLSVTDTGIGVKTEDQDKLFAKYFRAENAINITQEGTGLGIYVVKKLVEAHHGRIWFKSAGPDSGTTFYVTFPIPEGKIATERVNIASLEAL